MRINLHNIQEHACACLTIYLLIWMEWLVWLRSAATFILNIVWLNFTYEIALPICFLKSMAVTLAEAEQYFWSNIYSEELVTKESKW